MFYSCRRHSIATKAFSSSAPVPDFQDSREGVTITRRRQNVALEVHCPSFVFYLSSLQVLSIVNANDGDVRVSNVVK
jgi:hypothetical protein